MLRLSPERLKLRLPCAVESQPPRRKYTRNVGQRWSGGGGGHVTNFRSLGLRPIFGSAEATETSNDADEARKDLESCCPTPFTDQNLGHFDLLKAS